MINIIISNILAFLSCGLNAISPFFKTKRTILFVQIVDQLLGASSHIFVENYSASVLSIVSAIQNYIIETKKPKKIIYWLFSLIILIVGLAFNNKGLIGILPVVASIQYALWKGYCKNAQQLRWGMIINYIPWIIHDFITKIYVSAIIQVISTGLTIFNIIKYKGTDK